MTTATTTPLTGAFTADPVHSSFGFAVRYQGVSLFRGSFSEVAATLAAGDEGIALEGRAEVESISIRTPDMFRAHVLGEEFFDAANHPQVVFRSSDITVADDGTATVQGELTMKGITQPVSATGTLVGPQPDAFGNTRAHLALEATVDRTAYDMNWNAPLPSGGKALANEVVISVELSLVAAE